jgi:hypothetical protein
MQQTIVSVVLPVPTELVAPMQTAIGALHDKLSGQGGDFAVLRAGVPMLHFMSIMLFGRYDGVPKGDVPASALFVLEANMDGAAGPFWAALESQIGEDLRNLFRLCAPPRGRWDHMFKAITDAGSRAPVAPLLERQSVFPAAGHIGVRGMSRERILRHDRLFQDIQACLPPPAEVLADGAAAMHDWLRDRMLAAHGWLNEAWPAAISAEERSADERNLAIFLLVAVLGALAPWLVLAGVLHRFIPHAPAIAALLSFLAGAACTTQLRDIGDLLTLTGRRALPQLWWMLAEILLIGAFLSLLVAGNGVLGWLLLIIGGLSAGVLFPLALLRRAERADPAPADAVPDQAAVRALQDWEDQHAEGADHMGSVVIIKPGALRGLIIRFALRALHLLLRLIATDGYLGSMRTIHFAHWAIVDHGQRLVFFSNFDGTWESYLDDFIEKAHAGLTLAWGNCVGFPPARYCTLEGATQGRKFKNWARASMALSRFWYSAYPQLTVNQIWRQTRVAQGLSAKTLSGPQAALWAKDL